MKKISENVVIQIEVTNACNLSCANCSRLVGHHKKPFFMTLDEVRSAISSLEGYDGRIGLMGGEPTLHPDFSEILKIYREMIPEKRRREFWTDGFRFEQFREDIYQTFDEDLIHYNDHSKPEEGWHQPILLGIDELVEDKQKMWRLIDNCWVQRRWCASITTKGAFFCEVAAAIDHAMDGPGGWPVEKGWWRKGVDEYTNQKCFSCPKCSAALPLAEIPNNHVNFDYVSDANYKILNDAGSPRVKSGRVQFMKKEQALKYLNSAELLEGERGYWKSHPEWRPSEFRTKVWHGPGEGTLTSKEVLKLQRENKADLASKTKDRIAEIRTVDHLITEKGLALLSKDVSVDIILNIKNRALNHSFSESASFFNLIEFELGRGLTEKERLLIEKYSTDLHLR